MPKLSCPCGFVHDLSSIPEEGWVTVKDVDYEELIQAEQQQNGDAGASAFVRLTGSIYECSECGRIMWQKPGESIFRAYTPEQ